MSALVVLVAGVLGKPMSFELDYNPISRASAGIANQLAKTSYECGNAMGNLLKICSNEILLGCKQVSNGGLGFACGTLPPPHTTKKEAGKNG